MKLSRLMELAGIVLENNQFTPEQIAFINKNCQPFLHEIDGISNLGKQGFTLYRGMKNVPETTNGVIVKQARLEDRRPLDVPASVHRKYNDYFVHQFGVPFRNGVFCVDNKNLVSEFGEPYIICTW